LIFSPFHTEEKYDPRTPRQLFDHHFDYGGELSFLPFAFFFFPDCFGCFPPLLNSSQVSTGPPSFCANLGRFLFCSPLYHPLFFNYFPAFFLCLFCRTHLDQFFPTSQHVLFFLSEMIFPPLEILLLVLYFNLPYVHLMAYPSLSPSPSPPTIFSPSSPGLQSFLGLPVEMFSPLLILPWPFPPPP